MTSFYESRHCANGKNCTLCRQSREWRTVMAKRYAVSPAGSVDFDCAKDGAKAENTIKTGGGCAGCGGKSLTDLKANPAAMEAALAE